MLLQKHSPAGSDMSKDVSMGVGREYSYGPSGVVSMDVHQSASIMSLNGKGTRTWPSKQRGAYSAPSGLSDSEEDSDVDAPSFSIKAPTGYSDGESDDDEVTSAPPKPPPRSMRTPSPAQQALHELNLRIKAQLLVSVQKKAADFQAALLKIDEEERADLENIEAQMQNRQAAEAGEEAAKQAELSEGQRKLINGLKQEHTTQAAAMDQQAQAAAQVAAEKRQKAEAERMRCKEEEAAERRAVEEAARKSAEESVRRENEQQRKRAEAQQAEEDRRRATQEAERSNQAQSSNNRPESDAARRAGAGFASMSPSAAVPGVRIAPQAAEAEIICQQALQKALEAAKDLHTDERKKEKRAIYRSVNKMVYQIGGTQQQVDARTGEIVEMMNSLSSGGQAYAIVLLAQGFLDLAEGADSRFPVAEVAVAVCQAFPGAEAVLLGKLHQACALTIPKYFVRLRGETTDDYRKRWGYQRVDVFDKEKKQTVEDWEDAEVFLARVTAHIQFYAAFLQSDRQTPHAAQAAWSYLSRLLNALPPNRYTAFALVAFVDIAGYQLYRLYRRQFTKLLMLVDRCFIEEIIQKGMEDARSAVRRLRKYLHEQEYLREPVGRKLEMYDASTYDRA